jgi:hypothetical protein
MHDFVFASVCIALLLKLSKTRGFEPKLNSAKIGTTTRGLDRNGRIIYLVGNMAEMVKPCPPEHMKTR